MRLRSGAVLTWAHFVLPQQSLANTYSSPPAPIDFTGYKSKISAEGVVDSFQSEYNAISYQTYVAEELAEIKAKHDALVRPFAEIQGPGLGIFFRFFPSFV